MQTALQHTAFALIAIWAIWLLLWNTLNLHRRNKCLQRENDRSLKRLIERELAVLALTDDLFDRQLQAIQIREEIKNAADPYKDDFDADMRRVLDEHQKKKYEQLVEEIKLFNSNQ